MRAGSVTWSDTEALPRCISAGAADPAARCKPGAGWMGRNSIQDQATPFFCCSWRFFASVSRELSAAWFMKSNAGTNASPALLAQDMRVRCREITGVAQLKILCVKLEAAAARYTRLPERGTSGSVQRGPANPARPGREQRYRDSLGCRRSPEVPRIGRTVPSRESTVESRLGRTEL